MGEYENSARKELIDAIEDIRKSYVLVKHEEKPETDEQIEIKPFKLYTDFCRCTEMGASD